MIFLVLVKKKLLLWKTFNYKHCVLLFLTNNYIIYTSFFQYTQPLLQIGYIACISIYLFD